MKLKRIGMLAICIMALFTLTGCENKDVISKDDFISEAKKNDLITVDVTSQYSSYEYIKSATIAKNSNEWQIEFYVLDDADNAKSMFNTNKNIFENSKDNNSAELSKNMGNYSIYELISDGYFMYISRVENTLLYVKVKTTYKDTVKAIIKELGY